LISLNGYKKTAPRLGQFFAGWRAPHNLSAYRQINVQGKNCPPEADQPLAETHEIF